jgi:hypothetical protein
MKTNNVTAEFAKITIAHVMLRIVKRYRVGDLIEPSLLPIEMALNG